MTTTRLRFLPLLLLFLPACASLLAQGSPPMNTDDPGSPDRGHWEINLGAAHARARGGDRATAAPIFDVAYGVTKELEFGYVISRVSARAAGGPRESGLSNSTFGAKWRFHDGGEKGLLASVAPKLELNNPGSNSERKGLAAEGGAFALPVQLQLPLGGDFTLNLEVGRTFAFKQADDWNYGIALGRALGDDVAVGVELYGDAEKNFHRSGLLLNVGAAIKVHQNHSLFLAVGRELHRHDGPRATLIGYLGWQIRR